MKKDTTNIERNQDAVKKYFTKELSDRINSMDSQTMFTLLKELEDSKYWVAIIKYGQERLGNAQNALITLDPFKDPTTMARYQGVMSGLLDLQDAVITLKFESNKVESPETKREKDINELGGAYGV